jgi:hypothetical protein
MSEKQPTYPPASTDKEESLSKEAIEKKAYTQFNLDLMEEDKNDIRVCDNLGKSPWFKSTGWPGSKMTYEDVIADRNRTDSVIEIERYPLKLVFQDPNLIALYQEKLRLGIEQMSQEQADLALAKINYEARLGESIGHLLKRKKEFERAANRSTHLGAIARLAIMRPELAQDPTFLLTCREFEKSLFLGDEVNLKQERQQVLKLIKEAGLTPEQIAFEPEAYSQFFVTQKGNKMWFSLGASNAKSK